ncbi:hypothetical protein NQ317_015361 [Molorchus minor]|uniref:RNA-directed DNA polymerase n=1 Tax=Molorchus minor TaxID=1323400 RepID=A0ABQ9J6U7_9CUCU|nr:hypothetical protein NQ317_015361 [Molorchus minor]
MTKPLTNLLKKGQRFMWNSECQTALEEIREAVSKPLQLHRPDFRRRFILQTDGSQEGMGAVLYQEGPAGERQIVSYASATLNDTERRYHINEIEVKSCVWAIRKYEIYLRDTPFTLRTDSKALEWLSKYYDSRAKLTRWALLLQEFQYTVEHVPGKDNELPDHLSRYPDPASSAGEFDIERALPPPLNYIGIDVLSYEVAQHQRQSPGIQNDIRTWQRVQASAQRTDAEQEFIDTHRVLDGALWRLDGQEPKLVVPRTIQNKIIQVHHDEADHPGITETCRQIRLRFYFRRMRKQVGAYIKKCLICLQTKGRQVQPHAALRPHTATAPFQKISIDILGPYPETKAKNRYVILVSDIFTKWVEAKAFPLVNAKDVIKFLDAEIIPRFGVPNTIISDNGPQFIAANYENWARKLNINLLRVAIYHQRANPVERRVQEFKKLMRLHLLKRSQKLWDEQLPRILYVLRTRQNAATQHTPSSLLYGYEIPRRGEWNVPAFREAATDRSPAPERFEEADQAQRAYQEKYTEPKPLPVEFNPGDLVMVRQFTKGREQFAIVWRGPYPIHRRVTDEVYEVEMEGTSPNIHIDDLRPAPRIGEEDSEESSNDDDSSHDDSGAESEPGAVEQVPTSEMPPIHREGTPPLPAPSPKRPIPGSRRRARLIYRRKSE